MERIKKFTEIYENELQILKEGNAFVKAAKDAKDKGLKEFEFDGKKYQVKLEESALPKVGDKFTHPIYPDLRGKVLAGPSTYSKIESLGYDMPDEEDSSKSELVDMTKSVWYGVITNDGIKLGVHGNEIIKESLVTEAASKITLKRKYTESHPSVEVQNYAPIREKVLGFLHENGTVTRKKLLEFINGMNEEIGSKTSMKWVHKNSRYVKEYASKGEVFYKLTSMGKKIMEKSIIKED